MYDKLKEMIGLMMSSEKRLAHVTTRTEACFDMVDAAKGKGYITDIEQGHLFMYIVKLLEDHP